MRIFRKNEPIPFRFLLVGESGPVEGRNRAESENSIDKQNPSISGTPVELNTERFIMFDPSFPGLFIGLEIYVVERGSGTNARIVVELQKFDGSSWQTIGKTSKLLDELNPNEWNMLRNFDRYQSLVLMRVSGIYRFRLYEIDASTHTKLATSDGSSLSFKEHAASVHMRIYRTYLTELTGHDIPFYPIDISSLNPFEEDYLYMYESEPENATEPERLKGVYAINLPHGFQENGIYITKFIDERSSAREIELIKIVSGIIDGFSTLLLELEEEELSMVVDTISTGRLELFRGDSARWIFNVIDRFGNPVDLTDCTLYLTVKEKEESETELISSAAYITNPRNGEGYFYIPHSATMLVPGVYVFDIELNFPTGDKKTLCKGSFVVKSDVRR